MKNNTLHDTAARRFERKALSTAILNLLALSAPQAATITVDTTASGTDPADGACSLAEAISNANDNTATFSDCAAGSGPDTIELPAGQTISLLQPLPQVGGVSGVTDRDLTINGNSATIERDPTLGACVINNAASLSEFRLIDVRYATLSLNSVTLANGCYDNESGGAINAYQAAGLTLDSVTLSNNSSSQRGGAIHAESSGLLTVSNSTFEGNWSRRGGAIGLYDGSPATITNTAFSNNTSYNRGGAVWAENAGAVTVTDSQFTGNNGASNGGAINLYSSGPFTLTNCQLTGNTAQTGGVINSLFSDFTISDSVLSGNTAYGGGGAIYRYGGQIQIERSQLNGNYSGGNGGVIYSYGGGGGASLNIILSTLQDNSTTGSGGAIYMDGNSRVVITNSTIANNRSDNSGGAIYNYGYLQIDASTISGNSAMVNGGAVTVYSSEGSVAITRSTISGNTAGYGGGVHNNAGTATINDSSLIDNVANYQGDQVHVYTNYGFTVYRTLLAGSGTGNCFIDPITNVSNVGNNLSSDASCATIAGTVALADLSLLPLSDNGGPTQTHALGMTSVALNAGANCGPTTDQRGESRPFGAACDVGAIEVQETAQTGPDFVVNATDDAGDGFCGSEIGECTLRDAVLAANQNVDSSTITFDSTVFSGPTTIALINGEINAPQSTAISGPGADRLTIDAGGASRIFSFMDVANPLLGLNSVNSISAVRLTGGNAVGGAAQLNERGGAVLANAQLTMNAVTLEGNTSTVDGGAVWSRFRNLTISNSTLAGNWANTKGGGIYSRDNVLTVENSTISGNRAFRGGGIYNRQSAAISDSTIAGNTATDSGAGVFASAPLTLDRSIVADSAGNDIQGSVTANDSLIENPVGATITGTGNLTSVDPTLGPLQLNGGSTATHLPGAGSPAVDAFSACSGTDQRGQARGVDADGVAGPECDIGAVEVQNIPVSAQNDSASTDQDTAIGTGGDVLANDQDAVDEDRGSLEVVAVDGVAGNVGAMITPAAGGELVLNADGSFSFDPGNDFVGLDAGQSTDVIVGYTASDGFAASTASLTITVDGLNDAPIAMTDSYAIPGGEQLTVDAAAGLLVNDSDPENNMISVLPGAFSAGGVGGTFNLAADGSFTFDAPVGAGLATLSYTLSDGDLQVAGTVEVVVTPAVQADLQIDKNDGVTSIEPSDVLTYTIAVLNDGPADVTGAVVEDILPASLGNASWSCEALGQASCANPSGTGSINQPVDIPAGDAVVFELMATVVDATAPIANTATVEAPVTNVDPDLSNNSATDVNNPNRLFSDSFEAAPVQFAFKAGVGVVSAAQIEARLSAVDGHKPVLVAKARPDDGLTAALALVHARRLDEQIQLRISRLDNDIWVVGRWVEMTESDVRLEW